MIFRGRFFCKLDTKGRVSLPSAYGFKKKQRKPNFVITNAITEQTRFLDIYPITEWERLEKKILSLPDLDKNVQWFKRFYLSSGLNVEADTQGRLLIPMSLRQYIEVNEGEDVMLVGMGQKIELWNNKKWTQLFKNMELQHEKTIEQINQNSSRNLNKKES